MCLEETKAQVYHNMGNLPNGVPKL